MAYSGYAAYWEFIIVISHVLFGWLEKKLEKSLEVVPEFLSQHRTSFQEVIFLKDS